MGTSSELIDTLSDIYRLRILASTLLKLIGNSGKRYEMSFGDVEWFWLKSRGYGCRDKGLDQYWNADFMPSIWIENV